MLLMHTQDGQVIPVVRKDSRRARRINLTVSLDGRAILTVPVGLRESVVLQFWQDSQNWLSRQVARITRYRHDTFLPRTRRDYLLHRETARALVHRILDRYKQAYAFAHGRVAIKNLTRNWGSCSENGNLNFNYKLALLPARMAEYVVFHELCHLQEFSHSPRFWELVSREFPDHRAVRREMRKYHP